MGYKVFILIKGIESRPQDNHYMNTNKNKEYVIQYTKRK